MVTDITLLAIFFINVIYLLVCYNQSEVKRRCMRICLLPMILLIEKENKEVLEHQFVTTFLSQEINFERREIERETDRYK